MQKKLVRSKKNRMISGVCGGIAEHLGIDPTIVRLIWAFTTVFWGTGIILYLLAWAIIPEEK
ncbi:MAG: PspC domain-containing protein [Caldanaerobacter subterraneus]|nr:PspC domain-containing protein [Caldanaerobacter subterraneus]